MLAIVYKRQDIRWWFKEGLDNIDLEIAVIKLKP